MVCEMKDRVTKSSDLYIEEAEIRDVLKTFLEKGGNIVIHQERNGQLTTSKHYRVL